MAIEKQFSTRALRIAEAWKQGDVGKHVWDAEDGGTYVVVSAGAGASSMVPLSSKGMVPLSPYQFQEADGTALADFSDGASATPGYAAAGSEGMGIRWNNHATPDPVATSIVMPPDLDSNQDITVHVIAAKTGATVGDATTFDVVAFFNTVGALYDADADAGDTTSAMTGDATAKTVQRVTGTIAAADIPDPDAAYATVSVSVQPTDGLLGTDDVIILGVLLEYQKKAIV